MPNTTARILTVDGIQYYYDDVRLKMLSIPRVYLRAGTHRRTVSNEYIQLEGGQPAMTVGDDLLRDATITGITANCETDHTWAVKVFKKGVLAPLITFNLASQSRKEDSSLDIDVAKGSVLLFKVEGISIPFPRLFLELAWRVTV